MKLNALRASILVGFIDENELRSFSAWRFLVVIISLFFECEQTQESL
jgi:hypothetical protein